VILFDNEEKKIKWECENSIEKQNKKNISLIPSTSNIDGLKVKKNTKNNSRPLKSASQIYDLVMRQ
jgi:hypothetical protein